MELKIFDYGMNGEGVAKLDGKIILCDKTLINETVSAEIIKDNQNFSIAKATKILLTSKNRTTPKCSYFNICGGCDLQHMRYCEQLLFKQSLVKKTIKKICNLDVEVSQTIPSTLTYGYRNKMSFTILNNNCGLLMPNSKSLVKIQECKLTSNNINNILGMFNNYLANHPNKNIKNLVIREIENQILIGIVLSKPDDLTELYSIFKSSLNNFGIYEILNTRKDSVVLTGKVKHIYGLKEIKTTNFDLTYSVDLIGFHQTNLEIQNKLYKKVLNYINSNSIVVNGFSGQGLLSAIIAKQAKLVYGIEINKNSHLSAEKLKSENNIKNLHNMLGDFDKLITTLPKNVDTIVLDPAAKGCGKQVMKKINGTKNIIYISCNPIALCKDLRIIKDDYIIEEITPFDMFPNTKNVETLIKLKLKEKL